MSEASAPSTRTTDAIIIGAGFSGLYQLHCLRDRLGLDATVLEAGDGVGGTWYWNRYPGARCDSESYSYCYTWSEDLHAGWEWSQRYPDHAEIRRYLNYVADKLDLKRDIRFGRRVTAATFDQKCDRWTVEAESGERYTARYVIAAVGCLSAANLPKIAGLERFKGQWYHTGQWPHEEVDFTGKRVGLVGTGSTGIQCTPAIAETAKHLTVFQRTANYSVPAHNAPLTPEFKSYVRDNREAIRAITQSTHNGHPFVIEDRAVFDVDAEERKQIFERGWAKGGLQFRAAFRDILQDKRANDEAANFLKGKIRDIVRDKATAEKLAAIDHPYASKRPPIDTGYFEAFNRENVSLVDVRAAPIEEITETGIRTRDTHHELDVIVFATGFDAMTGTMLRMDVTGRDGLKLADAWNAGPRNYLGLQIAGFPNLFTVTGPGSPSVLCNMPVPIEQHVEWITACLDHMRKNKLTRIEAKPEAVEDWVAQVNDAAKATLLYDVAHSWYLGANVPGKPRVFMPYAGGMAKYRKICDAVAKDGYRGFALSGGAA